MQLTKIHQYKMLFQLSMYIFLIEEYHLFFSSFFKLFKVASIYGSNYSASGVIIKVLPLSKRLIHSSSYNFLIL